MEADLVVAFFGFVIKKPLPAGLPPQSPDPGFLVFVEPAHATRRFVLLPFNRIEPTLIIKRNQEVVTLMFFVGWMTFLPGEK
ncbi:putative protein OS=Bosea thiooxidans OX=53254 GN=ARD30_08125 PE=4 SV=1 [Bosea thiooxidans]|nr:hypothetical protein SAMN05660750_05117 [Bosea thiooxidans]